MGSFRTYKTAATSCRCKRDEADGTHEHTVQRNEREEDVEQLDRALAHALARPRTVVIQLHKHAQQQHVPPVTPSYTPPRHRLLTRLSPVHKLDTFSTDLSDAHATVRAVRRI